ncbi:hypothetical protein ACFYO1_13610 [Nocardia sp. NPDC006044]|uniref:hypothetical protein n=1 Tax=Nocardia sp. NPDC006044 TaxID=3364306 RepID=UPI0036B24D2B
MATISCTNGHFFVVTDCVSRGEAAAVADASGGELADLTTDSLAELSFAEGAFADLKPCDAPRSGLIAWFDTFDGGVPEGTVYVIVLDTGQVMNVAAHRAAAWTGFVLAESR